MSEITKPENPLLRFFLLTYLIFGVLFGITGAAIMLSAPQPIQYILPVVCAWSPTFALLLLFKKLYPGVRLGEFVKRQFSARLKLSVLISIVFIQAFILLAVAYAYATVNHISAASILTSSIGVLVPRFFDQLIRGPLGEEIGWRGYAQNEMQKKHSPLFSAVIIGVIWGFWHTPLWLVTSGYSGLELVKYSALFVISLIAVSVMMAAFYNLNKNLFIPILIHQLLNFLTSLLTIDSLETFYYITPLYVAAALVFIAVNPKKALRGGQ